MPVMQRKLTVGAAEELVSACVDAGSSAKRRRLGESGSGSSSGPGGQGGGGGHQGAGEEWEEMWDELEEDMQPLEEEEGEAPTCQVLCQYGNA